MSHYSSIYFVVLYDKVIYDIIRWTMMTKKQDPN